MQSAQQSAAGRICGKVCFNRAIETVINSEQYAGIIIITQTFIRRTSSKLEAEFDDQELSAEQ